MLGSSLLNTAKTEGTSQTYGQLIRSVGETETSKTTKIGGSVVPTDSIVKIVSDEVADSNALKDEDKARIALAAVSNNALPTVGLSKDIARTENFLSVNANVARVAPGVTTRVVVAGSAYKPREKVKEVLTEARKIDMMITLKSKFSEDLEFNNIKEVQLQSKFVYQFFSASETDVESQEDPAQDPYLKTDIYSVPRYVKLTWDPVVITEPLTKEELTITPEIEELKRQAFERPRQRGPRSVNPINREGVKIEVVDMHRLDLAMDSTSNKNVFTNSLSAVLNISQLPDSIDFIPIKGTK